MHKNILVIHLCKYTIVSKTKFILHIRSFSCSLIVSSGLNKKIVAGPENNCKFIFIIHIIYLNVAKQVLNLKGRYDKKAFKRLHNALLSLFDIHSSKKHIRLKVPLGEYGLFFVAFKRFFIISALHFMQLMG